MKKANCKVIEILVLGSAVFFVSIGTINAQIEAAGGGNYLAGYGRVYGSFGQASAAQSRIYDQMRRQDRKRAERDALVKKWGRVAVEKAEREAATGSVRPSNAKIVVPPPPVIRNQGVFRPDNTEDTGTTLADSLADTPDEKALIRQIYTTTKAAYEKEAVARGWQNNIAGGLTFFTVTALTVYHDCEEPSDEATTKYFNALNTSLDEIPEFAGVTNKDKQGFNNTLIGFSGLLLAGYTEGKQENNPETLATYKKLAGELIKMVLKVDPDNLRIENGQIVMK